MCSINIRQLVTKDELKRTNILLDKVKKQYGINTYIRMKNMLMTCAFTNLLQRNHLIPNRWINYNSFLTRNEGFVFKKFSSLEILLRNGLSNFFGLNKNTIEETKFTSIIISEILMHYKLKEKEINQLVEKNQCNFSPLAKRTDIITI